MTITISPTQERFLPVIVAISLFMQILDASILNTALPAMAIDLHQSPLSMQWAVMSYALTVAIFTPISGFIADKYGTKTTFLAAIIVFTVGSALCAMSESLAFLVFSRVVQGLGGALLVPVAKLILIKSYARERMLSVMNYAVMPALIAPVIGPLVGGYLVEWASWHWIFLINIPMGIMGVIAGLKLVPNYKLPSTMMDWAGFMLFGGAMASFSFAIEFASHSPRLALLMAIVATSLLFGYYWHAKNHDKPLFSLQLFKIRTFRLGVMGNLFTRLGMSAVPFLLPLLLQVGLGYTPSEAGWLLVPMAVGAFVSKPLVVRLVKQLGYRRTLFFNTLTIGVLIILLSLYDEHTPVWLGVVGLLIMGACNSLQFTTMNSISIAKLRAHQTSSGNSLISANQQLSVSLGIGFGASLMGFFTPAGADGAQIIHAFHQVFIVLGLVTILSGFHFLKLHKTDGRGMYR